MWYLEQWTPRTGIPREGFKNDENHRTTIYSLLDTFANTTNLVFLRQGNLWVGILHVHGKTQLSADRIHARETDTIEIQS